MKCRGQQSNVTQQTCIHALQCIISNRPTVNDLKFSWNDIADISHSERFSTVATNDDKPNSQSFSPFRGPPLLGAASKKHHTISCLRLRLFVMSLSLIRVPYHIDWLRVMSCGRWVCRSQFLHFHVDGESALNPQYSLRGSMM